MDFSNDFKKKRIRGGPKRKKNFDPPAPSKIEGEEAEEEESKNFENLDKKNLPKAIAGNEKDANARLRFYERVADAELFLLLEAEPKGEQIEPQAFDVDGTAFVLAFDREERLSEFVGAVAPFVALSGRNLVALLDGQSLGLGLNLEVAPSSFLLPPEGVAWLAATLRSEAAEVAETPEEVMTPANIPQDLLAAIDTKLSGATGAALAAYLVGVRYKSGARGHLLAFVNPAPGAETALTQAASEALTFSGLEAGWLDVAFFDQTDPMAARLALVGLRFDLPKFDEPSAPKAPGSDPDRPPRLK